jgi:hypothetical protein
MCKYIRLFFYLVKKSVIGHRSSVIGQRNIKNIYIVYINMSQQQNKRQTIKGGQQQQQQQKKQNKSQKRRGGQQQQKKRSQKRRSIKSRK